MKEADKRGAFVDLNHWLIRVIHTSDVHKVKVGQQQTDIYKEDLLTWAGIPLKLLLLNFPPLLARNRWRWWVTSRRSVKPCRSLNCGVVCSHWPCLDGRGWGGKFLTHGQHRLFLASTLLLLQDEGHADFEPRLGPGLVSPSTEALPGLGITNPNHLSCSWNPWWCRKRQLGPPWTCASESFFLHWRPRASTAQGVHLQRFNGNSHPEACGGPAQGFPGQQAPPCPRAWPRPSDV